MIWKKYTIKSVLFFLVALLLGCATRKTEQTKGIVKIKSAEVKTFADFSTFKKFDINESFDRGYTYTIERTAAGDTKESYTKNDKSETKKQYSEQIINVTRTTYKTETTYKSVKVKQTEKEQIDNKVFYFGMLLVFIFALVVYFSKNPIKLGTKQL